MGRAKGTKNTPQIIIKQIVEEHRQGVTLRGLSEKYNKPYKTIKNMVNRENKKKRKIQAGEQLHRRGRPSKKEGEIPPSIQKLDKLAQMRYVLASKERYIKRLEMENELMRDFLLLTERK